MPVPIISVEQMREWEKASWAAGAMEEDVIQIVGQIIGRRLLQLTRPGDTLLILAGRGHNGDDARAAQPLLRNRAVILINASDPAKATPALVRTLARRSKSKIWLVDALFGIGLNRPLNADWIALIEAVNATGLRVLAVDVPSGLNAATGEPEGAAIRADITLTVGAPKKGMLLPAALPFVGRLEVAPEIGLVPCPFSSDLNWTLAEDFSEFPPRRRAETHKGTYGHLAIFAGSLGYHGAAALTTHAAQRAQPGLVTLWTQPAVYVPVAAHLQAAMVHPWTPGMALQKSVAAILIGPGLAAPDLTDEFKEQVRSFWKSSPLPVVVDASALDWLPRGPVPDKAIRVITPHPGEAARMLGGSTAQVQSDRVTSLRELSRQFGNCHVVLKGHQTLVGRAGGEIFVNGSGNPFLAQGGSGDVLAGYLAGLLAQPRLQADPLTAIRFAVWEHGAAADRLCEAQSNWTPDELVAHIGNKD